MNKLGKEKKEKIFYNSMLYYYKKHFRVISSAILWLILNFYTKPILKLVRSYKKIFYESCTKYNKSNRKSNKSV
jgi:hypothetical protein